MASRDNATILDLYPGTFNARSTISFEMIFELIRRRVERMLFGDGPVDIPISAHDAIDLLSGHKTYIMPPSGYTSDNRPATVQLPRDLWIDEKTRLLFSDMATSVETPSVIDRISKRAKTWERIAVDYSNEHTLVIYPGASRGLHISSPNPGYFVNVIWCQKTTINPAVFNDVGVDVYSAAQYALRRADFEPVIDPVYTHVLRVRIGLRTCITGIGGQDAEELGGTGSWSMDIHSLTFARCLVPALFGG
jgi:hypothetical protein